ncbi:redox-sensitive transcriptional activator SoxR [Ferrimonas sp. SCSIO 43195]|uniref:redox-sensitive transcriptional activator SoxR n=1 Tax=Ferrimonas sp. SCSIO 43195 TaxID=2822844 RepID=UPI002074E4C1|nr:redox-sensitive transcriptional activator SoxR [Ferrimonas sp. SCSIO 43195]USD36828.1 redox-sensitive transcriptional activator SoxR [Ferrimonas sp. SCSIO 43195]
MKRKDNYLSVSEAADRAGVAASALRFYESRGLIRASRTAGNQRRFHPSVLRTISVIRVAQKLGLTLEEIGQALASLPDERPPNKRDWERLSARWKNQLDQRIENLQRLRDNLSGCIGCGCLSMRSCALFNPDDEVVARGSGPRFLLEDAIQGGESGHQKGHP